MGKFLHDGSPFLMRLFKGIRSCHSAQSLFYYWIRVGHGEVVLNFIFNIATRS